MDYRETLEYIHTVNWCFCKPGLERIAELCERLGNPQKELRFIHVAGTNGKGSFCAMLESVLRHAGYRTGLFTSPYIKVFNERMAVAGGMISDRELAEITSYVRPYADSMTDKPTEFELITAIAFEYFHRNHCDYVVLEAGMGGRLDSTNIITDPVLSVITGIAMDHMAYLGDTIEKIAAEKAGIIKPGRPVLYGGEDDAAREVIRQRAKEQGAAYTDVDYGGLCLRRADLDGSDFDFEDWKNMHIGLLGLYQPRNAAVVLKATDILRREGVKIPDDAVRSGLADTVWKGRFEILCRDPLTIFDGAHNPQGIASAVESIRHYFREKVYLLTGVLKDKDYHCMAKELSTVASRAFVITPENFRALPGAEYAALLESLGVKAQAYASVAEALAAAKAAAKEDGVPLCCLGSLYTYASL